MYNFRFYFLRYFTLIIRLILPKKIFNYFKYLYRAKKNKYKHKVHENTIYIKLIINRVINELNFINDFFIQLKLKKLFVKKNPNNKINKKILLVIGDLTYGGAERQIIRLANSLVKKNYKVLLVSNTSVGTKHSKHFINTIDKKVKVFFLNNKLSLIFNKPKQMKKILNDYKKSKYLKNIIDKNILNFLRPNEIFYFYNLHKFIEKHKPEIIHSYLDFWNIVCGLIGLNLGIKKIVLSCRNMPPHLLTYHRFYFLSCYKFLINFKNVQIINNSKVSAAAYEKWIGAKKNSIKVSYNFYDFKKKKFKKKNKSNEIILGSVGRFAPEKNYLYLIKLFKQLYDHNNKLRLIMIGEGYLKNKILKTINKMNLKKIISILPPQKNVLQHMKDFDCFILTSKLEGTPNVLLESQNVGTPVITTRAGGIPETIVKDYSGYLISGNNVKEDKNVILKYFENKNFFKKRNVKLIKSKLKHFKTGNVLKKLFNVYETN